MPYIRPISRPTLDKVIEIADQSGMRVWSSGFLNYFFSKIIWTIFQADKTYENANRLIGVLESVKQEFYRRQVAPYEDEKRNFHGDLNIP
jgi:hypothetical protein